MIVCKNELGPPNESPLFYTSTKTSQGFYWLGTDTQKIRFDIKLNHLFHFLINCIKCSRKLREQSSDITSSNIISLFFSLVNISNPQWTNGFTEKLFIHETIAFCVSKKLLSPWRHPLWFHFWSWSAGRFYGGYL